MTPANKVSVKMLMTAINFLCTVLVVLTVTHMAGTEPDVPAALKSDRTAVLYHAREAQR